MNPKTITADEGYKIILTGTYSSFNKGDAAMQISTAEQVKSIWPNSEIIISSPFPVIDANLYQQYKIIKSSRRNLIFSTIQVLRAKIHESLEGFGISSHFLINNDELINFQQADLVVDLSGDTITEDYGPHVTYSHLLPILLAIAFKKPIFICAQSIGPFSITKYFSRYILNKTTYITTREDTTYKYLVDIGVNKDIIKLTSDMAFMLSPASKKDARTILKIEDIELSPKPVLGVAISDLVVKKFNSKNSDHDLLLSIAQVLDDFIDSQHGTVLFVGHVTGPDISKDDRIVANKIKDMMRNNESAYVINGDYSPQELKRIISMCDLFMGARMHANIAALSSCVPTLAIGYSHKTQGIMSMFGMDEFVCDVDSLDFAVIYNLLIHISNNRVTLEKSINDILSLVKGKSEINVKIIKSILRSREL
ncbi:MAG: polysaccharide pyruvyl transferase family protein [Candidatus Paceibacterota bacterium]